MLWNSNFFMTLESMKILRILTNVWLLDLVPAVARRR
jgi:putative pyruvate formate lyase activating enzyme